MKYFKFLLLALALIVSGCHTRWNPTNWVYRQPSLHQPVILDYSDLLLTTHDNFAILTNYYRVPRFVTTNDASSNSYTTNVVFTNLPFERLVLLRITPGPGTNRACTNLVKYPPVESLNLVTNGDYIFAVADHPLQQNYLPNTATSVQASFQIESDEDVAEQFGKTFSSCFYAARINFYNSSTNLTFIADAASLRVMASFYLSEKDWKNNPAMRVNVVRRYGDEFIRMPRKPLLYTEIAAVFTYRQKSDPMQITSDILDASGVIASGATIFIGGALYPKAVTFAVGIVKPAIQQLILRDVVQHQANFATQALKDLVKVSPNEAMSGIVFFPKRPLPGYVDGHFVYLSSFNNSKSQTCQIEGSLVKLEASAQTAVAPSQPNGNVEQTPTQSGATDNSGKPAAPAKPVKPVKPAE